MIPDIVDLENNFTDFKISHIMNLSQDNSATFQLMGILQNVTMNGWRFGVIWAGYKILFTQVSPPRANTKQQVSIEGDITCVRGYIRAPQEQMRWNSV